MATCVPTVVNAGDELPARTPFKIQDPYTGRFVWNKNDNLHLRGNGEGEELLWELEYATVTTATYATAGTCYLVKNVLTGKVMVDESAGDGRLSRGFGVRKADESFLLESQIWTMRPLACDGGRRGLGRLYCIQNCRNRAYIVNGLRGRGKRQLRTRVANEQSKREAWRFILVSEPPSLRIFRSPGSPYGFERSSTSTSCATPLRIFRPKRSKSGDYIEGCREYGNSSTNHKGEEGFLHDGDLYWKRMPPVPEDCHEHVDCKISASNSTTVGDSNFLLEQEESSWMSKPHWKRWLSAVSDFDISYITPKIGTCTRTALFGKSSLNHDGNDLLAESPWHFQPKLEESP